MNIKNKLNFNKPIVLVLIFTIFGLVLYILFSEKLNNDLSNTRSNTTKILTQSSQIQDNILSQPPEIPQDQCNKAAKNYFNTWDTSQNNGFKTVNLNYQNYYDKSNNGCYVLVSYNFNMKDNSDGSFSLKITYTLVDIFRKDPKGNYLGLGSYSQSISSVDKNNNRIDGCNVAGIECYSIDTFISLTNPYIGK